MEDKKKDGDDITKDKPIDNVTKVKAPSPSVKTDGDGNVTKVDLSKPVVDPKELEDNTTEEVNVVEEITSEDQPVEDIPIDITKPEDMVEPPASDIVTLPENLIKVKEFMEETGGDLNDYVNLNKDYSELDSIDLLKEYYKSTKPHLDSGEINFLMEDKFSFDADIDEESDIKRKKLALKEQVAEAKNHLDGLKSKYYEDVKAGSKLTSDQQKAIDFFNRYNKEEKERQSFSEKQKSAFNKQTNSVFTEKFKGFEYKVGDKKFRLNVKDAGKIKESQADITNFIGKFLNNENMLDDASGYHKALYTANNADMIANHFYEQGKADALKASVENSKNINMGPRQAHSGEVTTGGMTVKVLGDNSSSYKFKIKNKK